MIYSGGRGQPQGFGSAVVGPLGASDETFGGEGDRGWVTWSDIHDT